MDAPVEMQQQGTIPGLYMRGGTSNGLFVRNGDIPVGKSKRDDFLLELFGSPDPLQINGIGGSKSHTSKFMAIERSDLEGVDVDYTFGQVGTSEPTVGWSGNCGNLTSAIGMYSLLEGLETPTEPVTTLSLYNTNTDTHITQEIPVHDGEPAIYGNYSIDGVPGTGAKISTEFHDPAGGVTGSLFPTGKPVDSLTVQGEEIEASIIDSTNLVVFLRASDLGLNGDELPAELEAHSSVLDRISAVRNAVADYIDVEEIPAIAFVSPPLSYTGSNGTKVDKSDLTITSRIISLQPHHAYAMTGAMCLGTACRLPGTIPHEAAKQNGDNVTIGHPKGTITVGVDVTDGTKVNSITNYRTARPMMHTKAYYRTENV